MKVYIRAATVDQIREQYAPKMDTDLFKALIELDPTSKFDSNKPGKYGRWIITQYNKGNIGDPRENNYKTLYDGLALFARSNKKFPKQDIFQYKTVEEFVSDSQDVIHAAPTGKEQLKEAKLRSKELNPEDVRYVVEDDTWIVYSPKTWPGNIALAYVGVDKTRDFSPDNPSNMKARWCTAGESIERGKYYFDQYTAVGPIYVFIPKNDPINKYQACFADDCWWFNKIDREEGKSAWLAFCEEHPIIKEHFKVVVQDGVEMQAGDVIGFEDRATVIKLPEGTETVSKHLPSTVEEFYTPDSVTNLSNNICSNCRRLRTVRLSENLVAIPNNAFNGCTSLESISIPDRVTSYGDSAFEGCTNLKSFKNSANVVFVGNSCFADCANLDNFELPDSVQGIGNGCFRNVGFTGIKIPSKVTELNRLFTNDPNIRVVDLNNVTVIHPEAFKNSSIEDIDLTGVTKIGSGAFRDCKNLKSVRLSPGVSLGSTAFANCPSLVSANVPKGCKLQHKSFDNCENLELKWEADDMPYEFDNLKLLICPASCTKLIEANDGWVDIQTY